MQKMTTFNVGPSKISKEVKDDIKQAVKKGLLEMSHRSQEFTEISRKAILGMKKLFNIPEDYQIVFTASATESIQLAVQNCCAGHSFHFINGNFSRLFSKISEANNNQVSGDEVDYGALNDFTNTDVKTDIDFISITHNETSSGVMCAQSDISTVRRNYPNKILAVDITSSAGATEFDFQSADLWIFSVQKCFGLPSGLGVLIFSPKALKRSQVLSKQNKAGIFTLEKLNAKMPEKFQTFSTPNVLGIYLLAQQIERILDNGRLKKIIDESRRKKQLIDNLLKNNSKLKYFVENPKIRSETIFCLKAKKEVIEKIHQTCQKQDIVVGKGYGELKNQTIRIANFPNNNINDYKKLIACLKNSLK